MSNVTTAAELPSYEIILGDTFNTIKLCGSPSVSLLKVFAEEAGQMILLKKPFLINCEHLTELSVPWIHALVTLANAQKLAGLDFRLIQLSANLQTQLKKSALDDLLKAEKTLKAALVTMGVVKQRALDVDFVNPFLAAVIHVLKVQASTVVTSGKPLLKIGKGNLHADVSGVIGITSDSFSGSVVICFPEKTFLTVMSRMVGEACTSLTPDIIDGVGELTNIIFGQAKVTLNERGYGIKTAIPSVISGKGHTVQNVGDGPVVAIPFQSDAGDFYVEICIS